MTKFIVVYCTFPDTKTAKECARILVSERLCACANIIGQIESLYSWKNAVEESSEISVIFKTTASNYDKLETKLKNIHPYDTPCIIAIDVPNGSKAFLEWVEASTV